jgi:hypothetical protein
VKTLFLKLRGRYRLWHGFCPACDSIAPEINTCQVCGGYRSAYEGRPTLYLKREWWERYIMFLKGPA